MLTVLAVSLGGLSTACSAGPDEQAAAAVARAFHAALTASDTARACTLLAPATRAALQQSADAGCADAIAEAGVPPAGGVRKVAAFGQSAVAVLDGDVVFMSIFHGDWKVTAAGCTPRIGQPYSCTLDGG